MKYIKTLFGGFFVYIKITTVIKLLPIPYQEPHLLPEEVALPSYEHGVSCVYCIDKTSEKQKEGFRMRQSQILAAKRKRL